MPIYGYACKECGHTLDALQKIAEDPLVDCPECGKPALKRQLSAPRFRLKGQGWYETDFKKDNKRNLAGDSEVKTGTNGASASEAPAKAAEKTSSASETSASKPAPAAKASTDSTA